MLEGAEALAEAVLLRRLARLALEPAQALVELVHLGAVRNRGADVDRAGQRSLGEGSLATREVRAPGGELRLGARERLLGLVQSREALLDVLEALLGRLGGGWRARRARSDSIFMSAASRAASSRSRRLSSCACAARPTCAWSSARSSALVARPASRRTRPIASASSRSRSSTAATRSVSSVRSRPSSCSAAMRIACKRSCSPSIETGSSFCLPKRATLR